MEREPDDDFSFMNAKNENLSLEKKRVIQDMLGHKSYLYRSDYPQNDISKRKLWEDILRLTPKFNGETVYRYTNEFDIVNMSIGDRIRIAHSLTTTTISDGFWSENQWIAKYIIRCKSPELTSAHDVSVLYNDSFCKKGECQVNFEENTSFKVDDIQWNNAKKYIYMHEL
ncbi:MAG: hypothetical protein IK073_02570 [Paludibacteraceae bacterium]|nr:hypothetical protein [Paludibacteraceae bacterium]